MKKFLFVCFAFFLSLSLQAQDKVFIDEIVVSGNKKTKEKIILRELTFSKYDSIRVDQIDAELNRSKQNVLNTSLFVYADIKLQDWDEVSKKATVRIELTETWFLYPYPIFELADRNFNVWWQEQNRSLERVNFGLRVNHINLSGNRDKLKMTIQDGYTKKYELDYFIPGINKKQTLGLFGNIFYSRRKEIGYITDQNKLLFDSFNERFLLRRFRAGFGLSFRPGLYEYHTAKIIFSDNAIGDRIAFDLNPEYFLNGKKTQKHFTLQYEFTIDNRDIKPFPLQGYQLSINLKKDGFGFFNDVDASSIEVKYAQYLSFSNTLSLEMISKAKLNLQRSKQPYTHLASLGYGEDVISAYELYVIDGMDFSFLKTSLRYQMIELNFKWGKLMPIKRWREMPTKVYLSLNNDLAYVNAPYYEHYGDLNNKLLWGGGLGLNFIMYYDKVIIIEYSLNQLGEKGVFLKLNLSF